MKKNSYSFKRGLGKSVKYVLIFGIPTLINILPAEWMNLTVSGVLVLALNWLKNK